ncbi:histidine triad nucleotide-binding protein [Clostridia bacterium]|nr:histidine triad nucleotide-binding protein [Clostridia bacterium]
MDCVFCKIIDKQIPSKIVYEDDAIIAIHDVAPLTPTHILIMPKRHVHSLKQIDDLPDETLAKLLRVAAKLAVELGLSEDGYRIVSNSGAAACQSVPHLHIHLLGGRDMNAAMA